MRVVWKRWICWLILFGGITLISQGCDFSRNASTDEPLWVQNFPDSTGQRFDFNYPAVQKLCEQHMMASFVSYRLVGEKDSCLIKPAFRIKTKGGDWLLVYCANGLSINPKLQLAYYVTGQQKVLGSPLTLAEYEVSNGGEQGVVSWLVSDGKKHWRIFTQTYDAGINPDAAEYKPVIEPGPLEELFYANGWEAKAVSQQEANAFDFVVRLELEGY